MNNNNTPLSNRVRCRIFFFVESYLFIYLFQSDGIDSGSIMSSIYSSNSVSSANTPNPNIPNRSFSQLSQLTQQQQQANSIAMTPESDSSALNFLSAPSADQRRQIMHHLVLLLHAHKCLQRERAATNNSNDNHEGILPNTCTIPHCGTMRSVLQHMTKCTDFKNCSCK